MAKLPHEGVYARIVRSKLHGVGVKAIRKIPKGTYIFTGDTLPMVWIHAKQLVGIPPELQSLYEAFAVKKGNRFGCPRSFNILTLAWYLNRSKRPNVACDSEYDFYALRDIKAGEELTVDYRTFSD